MALNFDKRLLDLDTEYLVFGWIRLQQCLLPLDENTFYIIPDLVIYLCLQFYWIRGCWDIPGSSIKIFGTISHYVIGSSWNNTSYGLLTIPSMNGGVYKWTLKIHYISKHLSIVGITSDLDCMKHSISRTDKPHYILHSERAKRNGDYSQVDVELDLNDKVIRFYIDGVVLRKSCKKIRCDDNIKYKLAVSLFETGDKVSIINFESK